MWKVVGSSCISREKLKKKFCALQAASFNFSQLDVTISRLHVHNCRHLGREDKTLIKFMHSYHVKTPVALCGKTQKSQTDLL